MAKRNPKQLKLNLKSQTLGMYHGNGKCIALRTLQTLRNSHYVLVFENIAFHVLGDSPFCRDGPSATESIVACHSHY